MSLRLRLTLLYSAILALTLVASGVGLYWVVSSITISAADATLAVETKSYAAAIQLHPDPDQPSNLYFQPPRNVLASQDYVQLRWLDATVFYSSTNLQGLHETLPLDPAVLPRLQPGDVAHALITLGGRRYLVCTTLLMLHQPGPPGSDRPIGVVQVGSSLRETDATLANLRAALLLGGGLVIILACGAGWALAGTALHPINRITEAAYEIGTAQDFNRRVDYTGPTDEVGRLASTFNTMLDRLGAAYAAQRRFVGDASHELRTPLTTIRGNLGLLERQPPIAEADRAAVVADLVSETDRLVRLVNDLLTLARSDAGRPLREEPVALRPLLADLVRRLAVIYPGRAIAQEGGLDASVVGDADAITQVVLILLDNALKFTPPDGPVRVAVTAAEDRVAIAVHDTGAGIASDVLPHIFERFYQGDIARTGAGAGLGLSIAQALVERQHGTITAHSQLGVGSTFTVTLPRARVIAPPALAAVPV